jgi:hypothetical protein
MDRGMETVASFDAMVTKTTPTLENTQLTINLALV